jgi:flagellar basal body-associated protein FliL
MEGKIALRDEIIAKINGLFNRQVVTNIFFTEFVVQ